MSPFRTSVDCSGFREQLASVHPGVEASSPEPSKVAETSRPMAHWWERLGRKRVSAALVPSVSPSPSRN